MENINNQIVIYQTEDGNTAIDVRLENETVWLSQAQMSLLFQKDQLKLAYHPHQTDTYSSQTPTV